MFVKSNSADQISGLESIESIRGAWSRKSRVSKRFCVLKGSQDKFGTLVHDIDFFPRYGKSSLKRMYLASMCYPCLETVPAATWEKRFCTRYIFPSMVSCEIPLPERLGRPCNAILGGSHPETVNRQINEIIDTTRKTKKKHAIRHDLKIDIITNLDISVSFIS